MSQNKSIYQQLKGFLSDNAPFDVFFENPFLGVTIADHTGKVLKINQSHRRITGFAHDEFVGKNFFTLVKEGKVSESGTLAVLKTKKEVTLKQKTSTGKNFIVRSKPVFDEKNNLRYVLSYLLDVSELQSLRDELNKMKEDNLKIYEKLNELKSMLDMNEKIVYKSKKMKRIIDLVAHIADSDTSVLITGASGVGKELIAKMIHEKSSRRNGPYIKINCSAIPETLLESELFGYEAGAFTGANSKGKKGLLEEGNGGTIFLDEIGEMPLNLQAKLLRFLQEHELRRLGSTQTRSLDIRIISATNANLPEMIQKKRFREDLYYRLNVIPIYVPSLEERKEDIPVLIYHFLRYFNMKHRKKKSISTEAVAYLMGLKFEGNVRQLENTIERLVLLSRGENIDIADIRVLYSLTLEENQKQYIPSDKPLKTLMEEREKEILQEYAKKYSSTYQIAKALGISQSTASRKLNRYGISLPKDTE